MPLQNRVTPFGEIGALDGRGLLMGNRGVLHDESRQLVRRWQSRRWIACVTESRGRRRTLMQPGRYTELFFLDEATSFAAGHRPCAECRRADYRRFRALWERLFGALASIEDADRVLHGERLEGRRKRTYRAPFAALPDGAFVVLEGTAWLVLGAELRAWSMRGYGARRPRPRGEAEVLTPRSTVAILGAGYGAGVHPTA